MKFNRVTTTLTVAFGVLIAILVYVGAMGLKRITEMNVRVQGIVDQRWQKVQLARKALHYSTLNSRITMKIFLAQDRNEIASLRQQRTANTETISGLLDKITTRLDSAAETNLVANVWNTRISYANGYQRALHLLLEDGQPEAARKLMSGEVLTSLIAYHQAWEDFVEYQGGQMNQAGEDVEAHYLTTRRELIGSLLVATGLACAIAGFVVWKLAHEMASRRQAERSLQATYDVLELRVQQRTEELTSAHRELEAGELRLRTILETQPDCVKQVAADGTILMMNLAGLRLLEADEPGQVIGRCVYELVAPEHRALFRDLTEAVFRGESRTAEFEIIGLKGARRWMATHACPLRDLAGNIISKLSVTREITERKRAEAELTRVQKELLQASRQAGMSEVATGVLHNVGNVLNSVNVSSTLVADGLRKSKTANLLKAVALLREHGADLGAFLTCDPRGIQLPDYLARLAGHLAREQAAALKELTGLQKNIEHIKDIVAMQQSYAQVSGVTETLNVTDLVEDALRMNASALERHDIRSVREFADVPPVTVDKHKVLQILVNLVRNAEHACDESGRLDRLMKLRVATHGNRIRISVVDNGVGIPPENLVRIFNHGFTTRKAGHGFGLHSGALAAKELGGALSAHSDGPGCGSTFTLELPLAAPRNA